MEILYKNKDYIVAVKPAGVSSERGVKDNMPDKLLEITGEKEIFTVHRLDTVTSGVMVYALNKKSAAYFTKEISENRLQKEYLAVVHGFVVPEAGVMEDFLFKDSRKNKSFVVKRERKGVKKASLEYSVVEKKNALSLVRIKLHTGRTHQIRVQFSSRHYPVYGDGKYGASDNIPFIALFSHSLKFKAPGSDEDMTFSAPMPEWEFFR